MNVENVTGIYLRRFDDDLLAMEWYLLAISTTYDGMMRAPRERGVEFCAPREQGVAALQSAALDGMRSSGAGCDSTGKNNFLFRTSDCAAAPEEQQTISPTSTPGIAGAGPAGSVRPQHRE